MPPNPIRTLSGLLAVSALVLTVAGCSDDDPAGPGDQEPYVGTWSATAFNALGTNFIATGMSLEGTFTETTYSLTVTGDQAGICGDEGPSDCTTNGPLSATSSEVTIDAGEEDEVTFDYSVSGNTMTWTGSIDETSVTVVWVRPS